ncbi:hypothetical protein B0O80DRAFT_499598 [Mortierella sp. GBAus27b]|nr:hypothetical protein BGX31_006898 [Mortierella sp. GBA43]KAI8352299.1 hypothetical protein B0O80DRAFT_499598 [Mortierella sp. GBAus27b]
MLAIPELNDLICCHLSPHDLAQCSRVDKTWHSTVLPYLWRDLSSLDNSSDTQRRAFRKLVLDDVLYQKQHAIQDQDLGLENSSTYTQPILAKYRPWVQLLPNPIRLLQSPDDTEQSVAEQSVAEQEPTVDRLLLHLLDQFCTAQISHFLLDYGGFGLNDLEQSMLEVIVPRVLHLSVQASYRGKRGELSRLRHLLARCSTTLEKLSLEVYYKYDDAISVYIGYDEDFDEDLEPETIEPIEWTSLKEFHIRPLGCVGTVQPSKFWEWVYKRCGQVERLEVSAFRRGASSSIRDNIFKYMPNATEITIGSIYGRDSSTIKEDRVANLLSGSQKGWKMVRLAGVARFGVYALKALEKHFLTLEVVHIDHISVDSSGELASIPSSCPNLHTFYYYRSYGTFPADVFADKEPDTGMLKSWACEKTLKVFGARIDGIPRPNQTGGDDAVDTEETQPGQGREIQGRIYDRLARFTNLETLLLGNVPLKPRESPRRRVHVQRNCLEMSLESGLDKLSELGSLKELSVEGLMTKIGLQEVQWMATHWPRLRALYGLDREGDGKEAVEWLEIHHPEIELLRQ